MVNAMPKPENLANSLLDRLKIRVKSKAPTTETASQMQDLQSLRKKFLPGGAVSSSRNA